jgi:hypothetical protein
MSVPRDLAALEALVANKVQESLHLEYKQSRALVNAKNEIAKDASAFANSDGGLLIYGIAETGHVPAELDGGIDLSSMSREQLEQKILSNVAPKIDGLEITQIDAAPGRSYFVINIPRSNKGPHQDRESKRYYKRYNYQSVPMEDYEIEDVRARVVALRNPVRISLSTHDGFVLYLIVENAGQMIAENLRFEETGKIPWRNADKIPHQWQRGINYLHPGQKLEFHLGSTVGIFSSSPPEDLRFGIGVKYEVPHRQHQVEEFFPFDLEDLRGSAIVRSELTRESGKLQEKLDRLTREVAGIKEALAQLARLSAPTGLAVSHTAVSQLKAAVCGGHDQVKLPRYMAQEPTALMEVIGVDYEVAHAISWQLGDDQPLEALLDKNGVSIEILQRVRAAFDCGESG